jgi:hypothetical protein
VNVLIVAAGQMGYASKNIPGRKQAFQELA